VRRIKEFHCALLVIIIKTIVVSNLATGCTTPPPSVANGLVNSGVSHGFYSSGGYEVDPWAPI